MKRSDKQATHGILNCGGQTAIAPPVRLGRGSPAIADVDQLAVRLKDAPGLQQCWQTWLGSARSARPKSDVGLGTFSAFRVAMPGSMNDLFLVGRKGPHAIFHWDSKARVYDQSAC